jgi:hypothetical protein
MTDENWYYNPKRQYVFVERRDSKNVMIHIVTFPGLGLKGGYRAIVSLDSFRHRQLHRWNYKFYMKRKSCPLWFSGQIKWEWDHDREASLHAWNETKKKFPDLPEFPDQYADVPVREHESVWAFYEAIGYDYKKQRLTDPVTGAVVRV